MNVIRAQRAPKKPINYDRLLSELCYYFPQYKYSQAKKLPFKRLFSLLDTARRERAKEYYELTQIASAPHTKKGSGVKKLLDRYKKLAD